MPSTSSAMIHHWKKKKTAELTYLYRTRPGLSILVGGKLRSESDSEVNQEFTSCRQVYIKFVYDFVTKLNKEQ